MKQSVLFFICVTIAFAVEAQNPVGKWKFTAVYSESFAGKKTDMTKEIIKSDSCFTKFIYTFGADGKIDVQANGCNKDNSENKFAYWKTAGKTIKLYAGKDDDDPESFELEVVGNKMRWIKRFNAESAAGRSTGIKEIVEEFEKQ